MKRCRKVETEEGTEKHGKRVHIALDDKEGEAEDKGKQETGKEEEVQEEDSEEEEEETYDGQKDE
jgi:hypothetical protein